MSHIHPESGSDQSVVQDGWVPQDAAELYRIGQWGQGYFTVNNAGHVAVQPRGDSPHQIDLKQLVDQLCQRDISTPVLLRFTDVLQDRLGAICGAFSNAIKRFGYRGNYACVYPIKVNQQRHLIEEVLACGSRYGVGLEVGSRPELLAIMALVNADHTPIVCNGFKDEPFIEAIMLASKIGRNVIPVVEKFSELRGIIRQAQAHGVRPKIGLRVKLAAEGAGRWQQSGGLGSKFGLFLSETLEAAKQLRQVQMLDCLKLLHFHIGSQVSDVRAIKQAINELARIYTQLYLGGAGLEYLDVGGGLGVDYDGSATSADSSMNYDLAEYANNVVFHVQQVCDEQAVPHPTIFSESGRALVAHHSVLVFDIVGWSGFDRFDIPDDLTQKQLAVLPQPVATLYESYHNLCEANLLEYFHDSQVNRQEAMNLFRLGHCSLENRALAERLFFGICAKVLHLARKMERLPEDFTHLESMLADTYFANCSIFQSLPDSWAIGQVFPIMPIHRLDERPTCRGVLADITCDSDGKIDRFIHHSSPKSVLELHPYTGADYLVGVFLVGAYQEILGDLHNLFGDTNAVHVRLDEQGRVMIGEVIEGDRVADVLRYVQFSPDQLKRQFHQAIESAIRKGKLSLPEARQLRRFYEQGLAGYTYLT